MFQAKETTFGTESVRAFSWTPVLDILQEWLLPSTRREFTNHRRFWPIALGLCYIAAIYLMGGLRTDHVFIGCLGLLDAYNEKSRSFLKYFFPFILTGVAYDSMRYFYWSGIQGHVHVSEPYLRDKHYFGVNVLNASGYPERLTLNEFFDRHHWAIMDLLCGFAYLFFVSEYLIAAFALFFTKKYRMLKVFGWCFFLVNCLGFITYFIYPAAPPWYVSQFGLGPALMNIQPAPAAAHRFDLLLGTHFFDQMYGRGIDVYGAYPSLHVAYPLLVSWVALSLKKGRALAVGFYFLMCFSAVYLQHHYVVDVLLGTGFAFTVLLVMNRWILKEFNEEIV